MRAILSSSRGDSKPHRSVANRLTRNQFCEVICGWIVIFQGLGPTIRHDATIETDIIPAPAVSRAQISGELAEWSKAAVLKTVDPKGSGGSNPSLSAKLKKGSPSGGPFSICWIVRVQRGPVVRPIGREAALAHLCASRHLRIHVHCELARAQRALERGPSRAKGSATGMWPTIPRSPPIPHKGAFACLQVNSTRTKTT